MPGKSTRTKQKSNPEKGWIYCISNPSFPGKVKIGFTTNTVEERMAQLDSTSVPTPFQLAGKWKSRNVEQDENTLHRKLSKYRVRSNREFFELNPKEAVTKISSLLGKSSRKKRRLVNQDNPLARNGLAQGFAMVLAIVCVIWWITFR